MALAGLIVGIGVSLIPLAGTLASVGVFLVVLGGTTSAGGLRAFVRFLASAPDMSAVPHLASAAVSPDSLAAIAGLDRLVHQPARLSTMAILRVVENAGFLYVMRESGRTRGNLWSHASKLESAGHLEVKKEFVDKIPRTLLGLTPRGHDAFQAYVERMKQVLEGLPD